MRKIIIMAAIAFIVALLIYPKALQVRAQGLKKRTEVLVVNYQSPALYSLFSDVDLKPILF